MERDILVIRGLNGKQTLKGQIPVYGAKNAALKVLATTFLFKDGIKLHNVPKIGDVTQMTDLLTKMGVHVSEKDTRTLTLSAGSKKYGAIPKEIAKRLRASIVLVGPLLARYGRVSFPHPGGCAIGARPIDMFLRGFQKMGARISLQKKGDYTLSLSKSKLNGETIFFKHQSVTGTETFMMAGVLAEGKTIIKNAALEPEIKILADYLNLGGAKIRGAGTSAIEITGTPPLSSKGRPFITPPDRIEAGSFLILGALAAEKLTITDCEPTHLEALIDVLRESGAHIKTDKTSITVRKIRLGNLRALDIKTHEYPGFPTDLQAPITVYLTQAKGKASVFETIFEGRFGYVDELVHMGAKIDACDQHRIIVRGKTPLVGKELKSPDLRAGLAYIIAAIVAKGESVIHNVENIDRGYEKIEERFRKIGVNIKRISN